MCDWTPPGEEGFPGVHNPLTGEWWPAVGDFAEEYQGRVTDLPRIDWVIVGGESVPLTELTRGPGLAPPGQLRVTGQAFGCCQRSSVTAGSGLDLLSSRVGEVRRRAEAEMTGLDAGSGTL